MSDQINKILNLLKQKRLSDALKASADLVQQFPNSLNANKLHAYVLMISEKYNESEEIFHQLQKKNPDDYDINNNLGFIYLHKEQFDQSEKFLKNAMNINPAGLAAYTNTAALMLKTNRYDEALKYYQQYFSLINGERNYKLEDSTVVVGFLDTLVALGQTSLAKEKIKIFLQAKFNEEVFYYYINLDKDSAKPEEINQLVKLYELPTEDSLIEKNRKLGAIQFAAARFYEKIDPTASEEFYYKGNKTINKIQRFMPLEFQKKVKEIKDIYSKCYQIKNDIDENKGEGLVFIVGMPRSGTTLLESIVANNEQTTSGGELMSMMDLCSEIYSSSDKNRINKNIFNKIGDEYLSRIKTIRKHHKFFIDKLPGNYFNIGFINLCLPKAKFLLLHRNLWDIATSQFKHYYISNIPYSTKFFNIAIECANFEEITNFWLQKKYDIFQKIFEVKYEDLVSSDSILGNEIYKFIGIDFEYKAEGRENFFSNTASRFQIRNKINQNSIDKNFFAKDKEQFYQDYHSQKEYWRMQ